MATFSEFYIQPGTCIDDNQLFNQVMNSNTGHEIANFINNANGHHLRIEYMDEHIKNQLAAILCVQFIDQLIRACNTTNAEIEFKIEECDNSHDRDSRLYSDTDRRLSGSFRSERDTKSMLNDLNPNISINASNRSSR